MSADQTPAPTRCPECGGTNGAHGSVHVRHSTGGGGWNRPCSRSTTPALARATEALPNVWLGPRASAAGVARATVSAALHDPSVQHRVHDALYAYPADDLLDKQPGESYHDHAGRVAAWAVDAVRAAILGPSS